MSLGLALSDVEREKEGADDLAEDLDADADAAIDVDPFLPSFL